MTVPLKTRILLADDHTVGRDGLRMVLDSAPDLEVVAEASDGAEAVELALSEDIHLAVLDVWGRDMDSTRAADGPVEAFLRLACLSYTDPYASGRGESLSTRPPYQRPVVPSSPFFV